MPEARRMTPLTAKVSHAGATGDTPKVDTVTAVGLKSRKRKSVSKLPLAVVKARDKYWNRK